MLISEKARLFRQSGIWTLKEAEEYDNYFKDKAEQHGLDPEEIDSTSDEKKKEFYDDVDSGWKSKDEESK